MAPHDGLGDSGARRVAGRLLGALIVAGAAVAVVVTLLQWETRPQTDDATVRANFVGIAPQVSGHIVDLRVRDNQLVHKGDLLFVVDPRPYEIAIARARANLALTRKEVQGLRNGVVTEDKVDEARTKRISAAMAAEQARTSILAADAALDEARAKKRAAVATLTATRAQHLATEAALRQSRSERARAEDAVGQVAADMNARLAAAEAALHSAELDLEYTRVRAPFSGRVVNLNISPGAFARSGTEVFTLVDSSTWYVMANFRETQLRHIPAGASVDLYLQSQSGRHFRGTVVGLGWAVLPENGTSVNGLPRVERSLDWIRLAARFPVRIKVEDPDESFRIGASAVATVRGSLRGVSR